MNDLHNIFIKKLKLQRGFVYMFATLFNIVVEIKVMDDVVKVKVVGMPEQGLIEKTFLQTKDVSDIIATWMFSERIPTKFIGVYINKIGE